jgi:hypothetical protein
MRIRNINTTHGTVVQHKILFASCDVQTRSFQKSQCFHGRLLQYGFKELPN